MENLSAGYPERKKKRLQNVQVTSYDGRDLNQARLGLPRDLSQESGFSYFQGSSEQTRFLREETEPSSCPIVPFAESDWEWGTPQ